MHASLPPSMVRLVTTRSPDHKESNTTTVKRHLLLL